MTVTPNAEFTAKPGTAGAVRSPHSVIVIGEALTDIVVRPEGVTEHPGGSPMNVAIGVARLGDAVELITRLGADDRGMIAQSHIEESGVTLSSGSIVSEPTSTATARLDETGAAIYEFDIRWSLEPLDRLPPAVVVHTGSVAAFLEPGAAEIRRLLADTKASTIVTFDPNIRASLLGERDAARGTAERLMGLSDVVKLSDEDAEWLYPAVSHSDVLDHIRSLGPALAIITRGADGAVLASRRGTVNAPGLTVTVADTIGAGDSFMSAVIHSIVELISEKESSTSVSDGTAFTPAVLTQIGTFAVRCAAITVSRSGANPPRLAEVDR
ncbi:carbohydrate kinase family protein [Subtercola lobariae]|uniref:Ribokinase n=1 Tax=Subtercola lobariae TaxID=1588641 RepID=A0A917B2J8_9MICO|nr:carbohydrate kinase [Subtercola lobariae]GGF15568.1 ribokinase [Subtercola lobariae]